MRHKARWMVVPALGLALVLGAAWSFGFTGPQGEPPPPPMEDPQAGMMGMPEGPGVEGQLGLTEEQMTKLRALHFENAKNALRARTEATIRWMELEELLQADAPDKAAVDQKLRALSEARAAALRQQVEHRLAVNQVLTPEQRTKMRQLMRQHMRMRMGRPGMGMRAPQGRGFGPGRGMGRGPGQGDDLDFDFEPEEPPQD